MAEKIRAVLTIIRRKEVEARTGLCRSAIYAQVAAGAFPKPIRLGASRSVGWVEGEIDHWIERQIKQSRQVAV